MAFLQTLRRSGTYHLARTRPSGLCGQHPSREFHWKWTSTDWGRSRRFFDWFLRETWRVQHGRAKPRFSDNISAGLCLFARQCQIYATQRLRRMQQMMSLYRTLYSEGCLQSYTVGFARQNIRNFMRRRNYVLFGGALFAWDQKKISDQKIDSCLEDVDLIGVLYTNRNPQCPLLSSWENVMTKAEMMVWRRRMDPDSLYEYKVFGTYNDCTAKSFFKVQVDLDYRKEWDKHAIETSVIDYDKESGTEVVYWATHFPFPMTSRDYVYARRKKIYHRHRVIAIYSEAIEHPRCPETKKHVRVSRFASRMVIKPFTSFDEKGFYYILTYHDDPKAPFPSTAVSWMTSTGVPDFVQKMHSAALALDAMPSSNFKDLQSDPLFTASESSCYS